MNLFAFSSKNNKRCLPFFFLYTCILCEQKSTHALHIKIYIGRLFKWENRTEHYNNYYYYIVLKKKKKLNRFEYVYGWFFIFTYKLIHVTYNIIWREKMFQRFVWAMCYWCYWCISSHLVYVSAGSLHRYHLFTVQNIVRIQMLQIRRNWTRIRSLVCCHFHQRKMIVRNFVFRYKWNSFTLSNFRFNQNVSTSSI